MGFLAVPGGKSRERTPSIEDPRLGHRKVTVCPRSSDPREHVRSRRPVKEIYRENIVHRGPKCIFIIYFIVVLDNN